MINAEALLAEYINANITICVGYLLWLFARFLMRRTGLSRAYGLQLRLLNAVFVAVIAAPVLIIAISGLQGSGYVSGASFNVSDIVVAHYLNGGFEMKAADLEGLLSIRDRFSAGILNADSPFAIAIIGLVALGFALGAAKLAYSIICLRRIVGKSYSWRRFGRIEIKLSDNTLVPFSTFGLRRHYVVLPSHMLTNQSELKVSLAHEFQHIRQGDLEWEVLIEFLKPIFFLNPAIHAWKHQVEKLRELNCDSEVLSKGRVNLRDYCETLLSVCQTSLRKDRTFSSAVPKVALVTASRSGPKNRPSSLLEERVRTLLNYRPIRHKRMIFALTALPLMLAVTFTALAVQPPADWSQDRLMLATVVNLDRLDEINRQSAQLAGAR